MKQSRKLQNFIELIARAEVAAANYQPDTTS